MRNIHHHKTPLHKERTLYKNEKGVKYNLHTCTETSTMGVYTAN